jgi:transcriptional regulatory protein GAL4
VQRLSPGIDIEEALNLDELHPALTNSSSVEHVAGQHISESVQNEALPLGATGFEWQEVNPLIDELADGMASLSVDVSNRGYLGSTSGAGLLRSLISQSNAAGIAAMPQAIRPFIPNETQMNFQLGEQLLNHQIINYLIDSYFVNYHTTYPFIHEPSFRAAYSELLPRPVEPVWQIFFYTVLTLGAWTVGGDSEVFDDWCYHKAVEHFQQQSIFELGSLPLVQALTLLSNYGVYSAFI